MPKLTKRLVDAASPAGRRLILWDTDVRGFGLAVTPTGVKSYVLNYRTAEGRERRYTIGKHGSPWTADDARARARDLLSGVAAGADPLEEKAEARAALTLADLAALYLTEGPADRPSKKATSWEQDRSKLKRHILPLLGKRPIKSLKPADVARLQADITAGKTAADEKTGPRGRAIVRGGKTIAARSTACLATMLQFAVKRGLLPANPAAGVELAKGEKKERFLSAGEVALVADALAVMEEEHALHHRMATAIRLLLLTGCRKNEILTLRWTWVDFERGCLRLPDSKTGAKVVQLAAAALQILSALPRSSPYVLPAIKGSKHLVGLQKAWDAVRARATAIAKDRALDLGQAADQASDLTTARIHDLRHTFASFAIADGATLFMVGKVLGHKQTRTTEVYAHLGDDPLKAATERTAAKIFDALQGPRISAANSGEKPVRLSRILRKQVHRN